MAYYTTSKKFAGERRDWLTHVGAPSEGDGTLPVMKTVMLPLQLFFSTSYRMNKSFSKLVDIGFFWRSGVPERVVRVTDSCHRGITFNIDGWNRFCLDVQQCLTHFDNNDFNGPVIESISHPDYTIRFTTSYSDKAIIIIETPQDDEGVTGPSVVMKKVSFDSLVALIPCVDQRLDELAKIEETVISCREEIVTYVIEKMRTDGNFINTSASDAIELIVKLYRDHMTKTVINNLKQAKPDTSDKHELILSEIITLFLDDIVYLVRKKSCAKRSQS